jgi:hypothetical protein
MVGLAYLMWDSLDCFSIVNRKTEEDSMSTFIYQWPKSAIFTFTGRISKYELKKFSICFYGR